MESRFEFHLERAKESAKEARQDGSALSFTRCMSHAKVARGLAKKANRADLEQEAQLVTIYCLETAGRRREAMEARVIAAAMLDNLEMKFESLQGTDGSGARLASVGGVPIDEVIQLLECDGHEQSPPSSGQDQDSTLSGPPTVDLGEAMDAHEPQRQEGTPRLDVCGRQIRDLQGRLATVMTDAPKLRRKPKFSE